MRKFYVSIAILFFTIVGKSQVISEIYAGGGNTGAPFTNDFIEIFNNTPTAINLTGYSVQYSAATTTSGNFTVVATLSGTLQPGQYFLVQAAAGSGGAGVALPTPDATGTTNLAVTGGKVILVNQTAAVPIGSIGCPTVTVVDFVGYGNANCFEGAGPAPAGTNTTSVKRNLNGCTDTNNNTADFATGAPNPQNTSSTRIACPSGAPLPARFANVKASRKAQTIEVSFSNLTETDIANYTIERSANGKDFSTVAELKPAKNNGSRTEYSFTDAQPLKGNNIYRVKSLETTGKVAYSAVVKINNSLSAGSLSIFPNPVKNKTLFFQSGNVPAGTYFLTIRNSVGQQVISQTIYHNGGVFGQSVPVATLQAGLYYLELRGTEKQSKSFVIE